MQTLNANGLLWGTDMTDNKMKIFYSSSEKGFFNNTDYGDSLPDDVVEITKDLWETLLDGMSEGKIIVFENGMPALADPIVDYVSIAEEKKNQLINSAMQSIGVIQLKLQAGRTLTGAEKAKLDAVLDYIDAVTSIDTSTAPDIEWPELPV
ncbi:tail fiber assembly protein [Citrobacter farmeri]|uniref:tail fiber assembly protein n=1 Tax=Citrobacter farmeri TaxID=67824 RepID=UPI00292EE7A3|nr:tail fiber assembly protein [Citrobacter farmeri]